MADKTSDLKEHLAAFYPDDEGRMPNLAVTGRDVPNTTAVQAKWNGPGLVEVQDVNDYTPVNPEPDEKR